MQYRKLQDRNTQDLKMQDQEVEAPFYSAGKCRTGKKGPIRVDGN